MSRGQWKKVADDWPRYYASAEGRFPGLAEPFLVVGIPHTSGNAQINFDPYLVGLAERPRENPAEVVAEGGRRESP